METIGYCVRVQALEGYLEKIRALTFQEDYTAILSVRHNGSTKENPHYHIVIRTGVNQQAFRVRMKKLFPDGKGNQHMSIVPWDGDDKALSYLFHEEPDVTPVVKKGITDEFETKLRSSNETILSKVKEAKGKASHTLEEDAWFHFQSMKTKPNDIEIASFMILHALRNGKYVPQQWLLKAMTYRLQYRLLKGDVQREEQYATDLAQHFFMR
ncbi:MAG: hypothetical protein [Cressdnaviricota sp.]|nr:MAG: hypothetical protein [Cressdnaviricota sp.]